MDPFMGEYPQALPHSYRRPCLDADSSSGGYMLLPRQEHIPTDVPAPQTTDLVAFQCLLWKKLKLRTQPRDCATCVTVSI